MQTKTFRAKSIQEALQLVRDNLGPDACVHQTREVRGLVGRRLIEVEASGKVGEINRIAEAWTQTNAGQLSQATIEVNGPTAGAHSSQLDEPSIASQLLDAELRLESNGLEPGQVTSAQNVATSTEGLEIEKESEISLSRPASRQFRSSVSQEIWKDLIRSGVEIGLADTLLNQAVQRCAPEYRNDAWLVRGQLSELIAAQLKVAKPQEGTLHEQRMVALVGPTGVGKTTLLGKIAARAYRESGLQVGIVTVDTWRGAAVEQLLEFAELVNAQLEVVSSIKQLAPALQRLREFDLVLIDTAGRSPNDHAQMSDLKELLFIAQPHEAHLVLSCNASQTYATNAIEKFSEVGASHLCISKLDDAGNLGQWIAPMSASLIPVMHLTHGQDIEKDLMSANPRHLASILLGHATLAMQE